MTRWCSSNSSKLISFMSGSITISLFDDQDISNSEFIEIGRRHSQSPSSIYTQILSSVRDIPSSKFIHLGYLQRITLNHENNVDKKIIMPSLPKETATHGKGGLLLQNNA